MHQIERSAALVMHDLGKIDLPDIIECDSPLRPNVYFSWDSDSGTVEMTPSRPIGSLMALNARVQGKPRWLSLNIGLETASFDPGDVLGVVAELSADRPIELPLFVRSAKAQDFDDTELTEPLFATASTDGCVTTALHRVRPEEPLAQRDRYQTLVIRLPRSDFRLEIVDLRVFVIPAQQAVGMIPPAIRSENEPGLRA